MDLNSAPRFARDLASLVDLPKPLATALEAHNVALATGTEPTVDVALEAMTITPDKVADLVTRYAQESATATALPVARGEVANLLARRIIRELTTAGPAILADLKPTFDQAAEQYTTAVAGLPGDVRPEALVRSGSAVLAQYEQAKAAAATLDRLRIIRNEFADLGVRAGGAPRIEQSTRVLDLEGTAAIDRLGHADNTHPLGRWFGWINTPGVRRLWWPTLEEQSAEIARIEATMPKRAPKKDPTIHPRGHRAIA